LDIGIYRSCKKCDFGGDISNFSKSKGCKWDRSHTCKKCASKYIKEMSKKKSYKETREKYVASGKKKDASKRYNDSEKGKNTNSKYYKDNKVKIDAANKKYAKENKDIVNKATKKYAKNNPHITAKSKVKRRTIEKLSTPIWSEDNKIKEVYVGAKRLETITGIKYEIDHIVPLNGKNVCGLHVFANLQILESTLNREKSNKENYYIKKE
jgi:hypothetical protein